MYMLVNMLKKQFHEINSENLRLQTRIKKAKKEKEKAEKECDVMKMIREDGQMESKENQEKRRKMLLEAEWKRKIRRKAEETRKADAKLKQLKREVKGDNLKHLQKELKFYENLNINLGQESDKRESQLKRGREGLKKRQAYEKDELKVKDSQVQELHGRFDFLLKEKFKVKAEFNDLILQEEMGKGGMRKSGKKKVNKERLKRQRQQWESLKEEIKETVEEIQMKEDMYKEITKGDTDMGQVEGLHYTDNKEILLTIDGENEMEEDVLFYLFGGRNLELYLELEGVASGTFIASVQKVLTEMKGKSDYSGLADKLNQDCGKDKGLPEVLGKMLGDVLEEVVRRREKSNPTAKKNKKKKIGMTKTKARVEYLTEFLVENMGYKVHVPAKDKNQEYVEECKAVLKKWELTEWTDGEMESSEEAWVRYVLVRKKGFSAKDSSLLIGSAFWNTREAKDVTMEAIGRGMEKYIKFVEKKLKEDLSESNKQTADQQKVEDEELEQAATHIQRMYRKKCSKKSKREEEIKEEIEEDIEMDGDIEEEILEEKPGEEKALEEVDDTDWAAKEEEAATKIQQLYKAKGVRQKKRKQKEKEAREAAEEEAAALKIQTLYKKKKAIEYTNKKRAQKKKEDEETEQAAIMIQKVYKGKKSRKKIKKSKAKGAIG